MARGTDEPRDGGLPRDPAAARPDVRASILDDLSTYYKLDPDECVRRCVHWEQWSVQEWQERPRDSADGLTDFYNTTESWSFDHIWAAYLQAEGVVYPAAVVAAQTIPKVSRTLRCLDFGSGVGDMGHLLGALGHEVDLAGRLEDAAGVRAVSSRAPGSAGRLLS